MMRIHLLPLACLLLLVACNNSVNSDANSEDTTAQKNDSAKTGITERPFGNYEGKPVTEYTMTNVNGMQVGIINYGGTVTKLIVADKNGAMGDVVTGFESLQ